MLLETLDAEELFANRLSFIPGRHRGRMREGTADERYQLDLLPLMGQVNRSRASKPRPAMRVVPYNNHVLAPPNERMPVELKARHRAQSGYPSQKMAGTAGRSQCLHVRKNRR